VPSIPMPRSPIRRFLLLSFVLGLLAQSLWAELKVATYNVRNYLLTDRLVPIEGSTKMVWREEYPKPEPAKRALRRIIAREAPDILALQEMGNEPFLKEIQRDLEKIDGIRYPHVALMKGVDEDRHLAVLSKIPFVEVIKHDDLDYKYFDDRQVLRRGLLEIQFKSGGKQWSLFNVHLKSKWTVRKDDPESGLMREAEARSVRDFLKKRYPPEEGYPYLLVGDFNDTPNSKPIARILKSGKTNLAYYLYSTDKNGRIWTHFWSRGGTYSQVDYVFASMGMLQLLPEGKSTRGKIEDSVDTLKASDHRMVLVELPF